MPETAERIPAPLLDELLQFHDATLREHAFALNGIHLPQDAQKQTEEFRSSPASNSVSAYIGELSAEE